MAKRVSKGGVSNQAAASRTAAPVESMSLARKISWWSLLAMIFIVPIAMSNMTWLGFQMPFTYDQFDIVKVFFQRTLGMIALAAWLWDILTNGGKIRRNPVDWLILAFLAWVGVSTVFSISPAISLFGKYRRFEGLLSFINYAVIYFLVMQFATTPSRVKTIAKTLFWSSVVVAGYGVMQSLGIDPVKWGALPFEARRAFSTYGNPDLLGGFLMFSLPVALGLVLSEDDLTKRLVYWIGFGLNVWCWIVAFTRGAWIGGAVGIVVAIVIAIRHKPQFFKVDWIPIGAVVALGSAIIVKSLSSQNEVMNFGKRFASILDFQTGSGGTRTEIWRAAIAAVKDRPIFGFGADTFRLVFPKYKPVEYVRDAGYRSVADNVHDYPLQLAAGIGIIGVALFYGVCVWAAVRSFKLVFGKSEDHRRILYGSFWAACAAYLVQLMFGLSVTGNTFLLWAAMGVLLSPTASSVEVTAPKWGTIAGVVAIVLAGLGVGYQIVYLQADNAYLVTMVATQGQDRVNAAEKAATLNPFNDMYRAEVGVAYRDLFIQYLNAASQAQSAGQDPTPNMNLAAQAYSKSVGSLEDTIKFVPWEYDNYVFLASVHNIAGQTLNPSQYDAAIQTAQRGIDLEPFGPAIRIEMARALSGKATYEQSQATELLKDKKKASQAAPLLQQAHDNFTKAAEQAKTAADMDPAYGEAWQMLASLYETLGEKGKALETYKTLNNNFPGNADTLAAISRLEASTTTTPTK